VYTEILDGKQAMGANDLEQLYQTTDTAENAQQFDINCDWMIGAHSCYST